MLKTVILSDGEPCDVKVLGLYALDGIGSPLPKPFTYSYKDVDGREVTAIFDIYSFSKPPQKPETDYKSATPGSGSWWAWLTYNTYQKALLHEISAIEQTAKYIQTVTSFILKKALVNPKDIDRIITEIDQEAIVRAALVPQVTVNILAQVLRDTYQAEFDGKELFDAIAELKPGHGKYNPIALWENELMIKLKMTEDEYIKLSVIERARKIAALKLESILSALEANRVSV